MHVDTPVGSSKLCSPSQTPAPWTLEYTLDTLDFGVHTRFTVCLQEDQYWEQAWRRAGALWGPRFPECTLEWERALWDGTRGRVPLALGTPHREGHGRSSPLKCRLGTEEGEGRNMWPAWDTAWGGAHREEFLGSHWASQRMEKRKVRKEGMGKEPSEK